MAFATSLCILQMFTCTRTHSSASGPCCTYSSELETCCTVTHAPWLM